MATGDSKKERQAKAARSKEIQDARMQKPTPKGQFRTDNPCILRDGSVDPSCKDVYQRTVAGREKGEDFVKSLDAQGVSEKDIFMATVQKLMNRSLGYVGAYLDSKNQSRRYNQKEAMAIADAIMSKANVGENPGRRLSSESDEAKGKRAEKRQANKESGAKFEPGKKASTIRQQRRQPGEKDSEGRTVKVGGRYDDALGMPETWQKPGTGVDKKTTEIRKNKELNPIEPGQVKSDVDVDGGKGTSASKPEKTPPKVPSTSYPASPIQRRIKELSKEPTPTYEQDERINDLVERAKKNEISSEEFKAGMAQIMDEVQNTGGAARESLRKEIQRKKDGEGYGAKVPLPGSKAYEKRQEQIKIRKEKEKADLESRLAAAAKKKKEGGAKAPVDTQSRISEELKTGGLGGKLETTREDWLRDDDNEGDPVEQEPQQEGVNALPEETKPSQEESGPLKVSQETAEAFERLTPNLSAELKNQFEIQARVNSGINVDTSKKILPRIVNPAQAAKVKAEIEKLKKDPEQVDYLVEESIFNVKDLNGIEDPNFDTLASQYLNNLLSGGKEQQTTSPIKQEQPQEVAGPPQEEGPDSSSGRKPLREEGLGTARTRSSGRAKPSGFKPVPGETKREVKGSLAKAASQNLTPQQVVEEYKQGTLFPSGLVTETSATNPLEGGTTAQPEQGPEPTKAPEELGGDLFARGNQPPETRRESTRQIPLPLGRENTKERLAARAKTEERRLAKASRALGKPGKRPRKKGKAPVQQSLFTPKGNPRRFNTSEMSYDEFSQSIRSLIR